MRSTLPTIVALASGIQLAAAGWTDASSFTCPANTNNECNSQQSSGFDWSSLSLGSFSTYGDFEFEGFSCASSFGGSKKRDILTGRTFQDKCITGTSSTDVSSCPSFGCGSSSSVSEFSITEVQISVEFDCDIEFHYSMPGGTTCKQTSPCSAGGSTITNTQCGGAKNVTIVYPSQSSGSGVGKSSCSIGVHSVGFDCSSASSTVYHSTSTKTTSAKATTSAVITTSSVPAQTTSTSSSAQVVTTSSAAIITSSSSAQIEITSSSSSVEIETTSAAASTSISSAGFINSTTSSTAVATSSYTPSASEVITTVIVDTTTTVCPVTLTHTTGGTTSLEVSASTSTVLITTTKTICTRCEAESSSAALATSSAVIATSSVIATTSTSSSAPVTTAPCPEVLPQCLNTWLFSEGCSSNTDIDCFCPSSTFVSNIFACLSAYGASDDEISSAQTYFQGICAPYIPSNPAIVTCASSLLTSTTVQTTVPVTTVEIYTTIVVPCTESTGSLSGSAIPSSSTTTILSTSVVIPQVVFVTTTGASSTVAVLATGVPSSGAAAAAVGATTLATPAQTTLSVTSTGKSNGTIQASSTPTQQTTSAAGKNSMTLGSILAAVLFAVMIL